MGEEREVTKSKRQTKPKGVSKKGAEQARYSRRKAKRERPSNGPRSSQEQAWPAINNALPGTLLLHSHA